MATQESNPHGSGYVSLSLEDYMALQEKAAKFDILRAHGVDNWDFYGEAMREYYGEDDEWDDPAEEGDE